MANPGVLLMAFGGPATLDDVVPFMQRLMGREPAPEIVEQVKLRYLTIGGGSPLPGIAAGIGSALSEKLAERGRPTPVAVGMRYSAPFISDAIDSLRASGVDRIVTVSLSPFESQVSSGAYRQAVRQATDGVEGLEVIEAPPFHLAPGFVGLFADSCLGARERLGELAPGPRVTVFTAHSLPIEDLAEDPYVDQLQELCAAVAEKAGLRAPEQDAEVPFMPGVKVFGAPEGDDPWLLAYQSKGRKPGTWLGPDVDEVVRAAAAAGIAGVATCPVGFVTDHMETLYDLDVVAAGIAFDSDIEFTRAAVPNDAPAMIEVLAETVMPRL